VPHRLRRLCVKAVRGKEGSPGESSPCRTNDQTTIVCVCMHVCVCVRARVCVCACVWVSGQQFLNEVNFDLNIWRAGL